jgi:hypothetical protein
VLQADIQQPCFKMHHTKLCHQLPTVVYQHKMPRKRHIATASTLLVACHKCDICTCKAVQESKQLPSMLGRDKKSQGLAVAANPEAWTYIHNHQTQLHLEGD